MTEAIVPTVRSEEVQAFVAASGMQKTDLELLFGFTPAARGKNIRRWELYGATPIASVLMAYMARYGFDLAKAVVEGPDEISLSETAKLPAAS